MNREELVERLAEALKRHAGSPHFDDAAEDCLASIEEAGMVVVPLPADNPAEWWRTCSCVTCQNRREAEAALTALAGE